MAVISSSGESAKDGWDANDEYNGECVRRVRARARANMIGIPPLYGAETVKFG